MKHHVGLVVAIFLGAVGLSATSGCGLSDSLGTMSLDPEKAAQAAFEEYDSNQDGVLSKLELVSCNGIVAAWDRFDTDRSNDISASEISERIATIQSLPRTNMFASCQVFLDGKPLSDATVRFIPSNYQRGAIRSASGTTGENGSCVLLLDDDSKTEAERANLGVDSGTYRVEIVHNAIMLPAKYNAESELGIELALDAGRNAEVVLFDLRSQ